MPIPVQFVKCIIPNRKYDILRAVYRTKTMIKP